MTRATAIAGFLLAFLATPCLAATGDHLNRAAVLGALTFEDNFDRGAIDAKKWDTYFWYGTPGGVDASSRTFGNGDLAIQSDIGYNGVNPFGFYPPGGLTISVRPNLSPNVAKSGGRPFTGGALNTRNHFTQTFGYFEAKAIMPAQLGFWGDPLWLLGHEPGMFGVADQFKDREIDHAEIIGADPAHVYLSTHEAYQPPSAQAAVNQTVALATNYAGYERTYGVLVTPTQLVWYVDGVEVQRESNVGRFDFPLYIVLDATAGPAGWNNNVPPKGWPGADMTVEFVRAYALAPNVP